MKHVVVIGGGVMGSATAWQLASRGNYVTVLERFSPGHTNGSSHGTSRIFRLAYPDPFYVRLAARAIPLWRQLEQESGRSVLTLTGAVDHGPPATIDALRAALRATGHRSEVLRPSAADERWPGLRFDASVLFHPTAGRLHADDAVIAFQHAAAAKGADIRHGVRVAAVRRVAGDRVEIVTGDQAVIAADAAVIAVGGWASSLAGSAVSGLPPLRVTQEQPLHFPVASALSWPSFIHHGGAALPPEAFIYGLGATGDVPQVKVGFHGVGPVVDPDHRDRAVDDRAADQVRAYAAAWLPGLDGATGEATTCLYTMTADEDFVVDRRGPVTVLAGFSGHGFKFAPVIGQIAADLVGGATALRRFALGAGL